MAPSSMAPRSSVTDDVPIFTTTRTSLAILEAEVADPDDIAVGRTGAGEQLVDAESLQAVADVGGGVGRCDVVERDDALDIAPADAELVVPLPLDRGTCRHRPQQDDA